MSEENIYKKIGRPSPEDSDTLYIPDLQKIGILNSVNTYMFGDSVGDVLGFDGKVSGRDLIISYKVTDISLSSTADKSDYPTIYNEFANLVKTSGAVSFVPKTEYILIEITIKDFFNEE